MCFKYRFYDVFKIKFPWQGPEMPSLCVCVISFTNQQNWVILFNFFFWKPVFRVICHNTPSSHQNGLKTRRLRINILGFLHIILKVCQKNYEKGWILTKTPFLVMQFISVYWEVGKAAKCNPECQQNSWCWQLAEDCSELGEKMESFANF